MLRGGDKAVRTELLKQVEEQRKQIASYERKLKDVVRAYKGLTAEKDALQATVEALSAQDAPLCESATTSADESFGTKDGQSGSESEATKRRTMDEKVETLKRSLATLTAEKTRREAALQADKKALLIENEALKDRIQKSADETEAQAEKLEHRMKELRAKIKRIEEDRERELADHGSVLAEMQQRYAKERANCEQMERQITELYKKLNQHEEVPLELETKLGELKSELKAANEEAAFWKAKAEKTPTVQMLESELQHLKEGSQNEISQLKLRILSAENPERQARLDELEKRVRDMTATLGDLERSRSDERHRLEELKRKNEHLQVENTALKKELEGQRVERSEDAEFLQKKFIELAQKLRVIDSKINLYDLLNLEKPSTEQMKQYEQLKDEFERYKMKAQAVLKSRDLPEGCLDGREMPRALLQPLLGECSSCASADADLRHMRSVIASLHEKLHTLQLDHANAKRDHEEKCADLQATIVEMQISQAKATSELRHQMQQKVSEVEEEMQKQRARTLEILAEKEKELEATKTILVSVRSQQIGVADPVDPAQANVHFQPVKFRKSRSKDFVERIDWANDRRKSEDSAGAVVMARPLSDAESYSSFVEQSAIERPPTSPSNAFRAPFSLTTVSNNAETRNIFYEQQLAKREKELLELRCALEASESNMREIQQASLTKDLQRFEIIEKLKDEIRILEGKVNFYSGDANMEYLRNVFIQLLHCESCSGRKHILKAIGTVLKLSTTEMKSLEKHSFW
uniref:GRIP domain-containing protein n=2 Tax=Parascaris univalens TaxID=6257 RepID=A0A915BB38_PARUN